MDQLFKTHLQMTLGCVMGATIMTGMWASMFMPGQRNTPGRAVKAK